jgi:hypothetical protein
MSDLKYKATERYSFGWTDSKFAPAHLADVDPILNNEFESWSLENLRNAWLVRFGSGMVAYQEILSCEDKDYMDIAILLDRKNQLEVSSSPEYFYPSYRLIPCKS